MKTTLKRAAASLLASCALAIAFVAVSGISQAVFPDAAGDAYAVSISKTKVNTTVGETFTLGVKAKGKNIKKKYLYCDNDILHWMKEPRYFVSYSFSDDTYDEGKSKHLKIKHFTDKRGFPAIKCTAKKKGSLTIEVEVVGHKWDKKHKWHEQVWKTYKCKVHISDRREPADTEPTPPAIDKADLVNDVCSLIDNSYEHYSNANSYYESALRVLENTELPAAGRAYYTAVIEEVGFQRSSLVSALDMIDSNKEVFGSGYASYRELLSKAVSHCDKSLSFNYDETNEHTASIAISEVSLYSSYASLSSLVAKKKMLEEL